MYCPAATQTVAGVEIPERAAEMDVKLAALPIVLLKLTVLRGNCEYERSANKLLNMIKFIFLILNKQSKRFLKSYITATT
jgi:hypothetical protein